LSPARGPPADWGELVQAHFRPGNHSGTDRRAARDRHPQPLTGSHATVRTAREKSGFKAGLRQRENPALSVDVSSSAPRSERRIQPGQSRLLLLMVLAARPTLAEVPLADLSLGGPRHGNAALPPASAGQADEHQSDSLDLRLDPRPRPSRQTRRHARGDAVCGDARAGLHHDGGGG
jgi:hypothetical protein